MSDKDIIAVQAATVGCLLLALIVILLLCLKFRQKNNSVRLSSSRVSNPEAVQSPETLTVTPTQDSGDSAGLLSVTTIEEEVVSPEEPTERETEIHPKQTNYLQNETSDDDDEPKLPDYMSMNSNTKSVRHTSCGFHSSPDVNFRSVDNNSLRLPCQSITRLDLSDRYNDTNVKYRPVPVAHCSPIKAEQNMENESALNRVEHEELVSVCQKGNPAQAMASDVDQNVSLSESVLHSLDNLFKEESWRLTPSGCSKDFLRDDLNVPQRQTTECVPGRSPYVNSVYVEMEEGVTPIPYKPPRADRHKGRRRTLPNTFGNHPRNSSPDERASEHLILWYPPLLEGGLHLTDEHPPSRHNPNIRYVNFRGFRPRY